MRRRLLLLGLLAGLAAPAAHAEAGLPKLEADVARAWRGKYCTPTGCGPAPATSAASVLGFGASVLGAAWVSRRRDRTPR